MSDTTPAPVAKKSFRFGVTPTSFIFADGHGISLTDKDPVYTTSDASEIEQLMGAVSVGNCSLVPDMAPVNLKK